MADRYLHIVSFDVPWPPDYGGVIDVFYKVKALSELGIKLHLHCFEYGRRPAPELERYCVSVDYYPRRSSKHLLLSSLPYVVVSRRNEELLDRLLQDEHPILFEGLHACYFLGDPRLHGRMRAVRAHNVEHEYYAALAKAERSAFRRAYFVNEARKLERFEPVLSEADHIIAISPKDQMYFIKHFGRAEHVPAFHACGRIEVPPGIGDYALYHGALSVPENDQAALYLVREVFPGLPVKLIDRGQWRFGGVAACRGPGGQRGAARGHPHRRDPPLGARSPGERPAHLPGHWHQIETVALSVHRPPRGVQYPDGAGHRPGGCLPGARRSGDHAALHTGLHVAAGQRDRRWRNA